MYIRARRWDVRMADPEDNEPIDPVQLNICRRSDETQKQEQQIKIGFHFAWVALKAMLAMFSMLGKYQEPSPTKNCFKSPKTVRARIGSQLREISVVPLGAKAVYAFASKLTTAY